MNADILNNIINFWNVIITVVILVIVAWLTSKRRIEELVEKQVKDEIEKVLKTYKREIVSLLEDIKSQNEFKNSKILIVNDKNHSIDTLTFLSNFTNKEVVSDVNELLDKDLKNYSMIIIDNEDEHIRDKLDVWKHILSKIPDYIPILVYTGNNRLSKEEQKLLARKLYTPVNSNFTLIERLYIAHIMKKVMEGKK